MSGSLGKARLVRWAARRISAEATSRKPRNIDHGGEGGKRVSRTHHDPTGSVSRSVLDDELVMGGDFFNRSGVELDAEIRSDDAAGGGRAFLAGEVCDREDSERRAELARRAGRVS